MKLAVLNTSILTTTGTFELQDITLQEAQQLVKDNEILSAVGHQSTAEEIHQMGFKFQILIRHK